MRLEKEIDTKANKTMIQVIEDQATKNQDKMNYLKEQFKEFNENLQFINSKLCIVDQIYPLRIKSMESSIKTNS